MALPQLVPDGLRRGLAIEPALPRPPASASTNADPGKGARCARGRSRDRSPSRAGATSEACADGTKTSLMVTSLSSSSYTAFSTPVTHFPSARPGPIRARRRGCNRRSRGGQLGERGRGRDLITMAGGQGPRWLARPAVRFVDAPRPETITTAAMRDRLLRGCLSTRPSGSVTMPRWRSRCADCYSLLDATNSHHRPCG